MGIVMVGLQDEADNEYEAEQEVADEFDSDFNDDVGALTCRFCSTSF